MATEQMAGLVMLQVKVGLFPGVFKFADEGVVSDMRLQPFRHHLAKLTSRERMLVKDENVIRVYRLYAPAGFFDSCKMMFDRNPNIINNMIRLTYATSENYAHFINSWLAIVNHYGFDADYDPEFVRLVGDITSLLIAKDAYRRKDFGPPDVAPGKSRAFHRRFYTDNEFEFEFDKFLTKYNL